LNDRQLKYILTLAEEGNMTGAAQKLYISQPSLSNMLAGVENELGAVLFERKTARMTLTPAGRCYVEAAKSILRIKSDLERQLGEVRQHTRGHISIGCGRQICTFLFPLIIPAFRRSYPGLTVHLFEDSLSVLQKMLLDGELDFVFSYEEMHGEQLCCVHFLDEEAVLFAPPGFCLDTARQVEGRRLPVIDFKELDGKPFVLYKKGNRLRELTDRVFETFACTPEIVLETDNWQTCIGMTAAGEAFSILPSHTILDNAAKTPILAYCLEGQHTRSLHICYRKAVPAKIAADFIELAKQAISDAP
jgi:LysR family cyn operon transcriptional activator